MAEMMISGAVMICVVLIVRQLTFGKISMRLRYALWLAVAVRLILPFHFGSSPYSIMSGIGQIRQYYSSMRENEQSDVDGGYDPGEKDRQTADDTAGSTRRPDMIQDMSAETESAQAEPAAGGLTDMETGGIVAGVAEPEAFETVSSGDKKNMGRQYRLSQEGISGFHMAVKAVWIIGMMVAGGFMLFRQVRFVAYLHRIREQAQTACLPETWIQRLAGHGLRVWLVRGLPSPCLAGRDIYINPELYADEEARLHILAHEYAHAVQRDTLWAAVRSALCVIWWFQPLVWLAAYAAKHDSELACDERAVALLGETQRFSYGRTLLTLIHSGHDRSSACGVVLSMAGSGRRIRQRISAIADTRKRSSIAVGGAALTVLLLCGCAYTGAQTTQDDPAERIGNTGRTAAEQSTAAPEQAQGAVNRMEADAEHSAAMQAEEEELHKQEEVVAELSAELQTKEEMLRKQMEVIEEERAQLEQLQKQREQAQKQIEKQLEQIEAEWQHITREEFEKVLSAATDDMLESAGWIDRMEYFDYLYNGGVCPMEDGRWYLIHRDERYGIDFYGLYTDKYGSRGVKVLVDGDVNTLDITWRSAVYESGIEVFMIGRAQDGRPRTFAFQMCEALTSGNVSRWKLYLVDRYDTGAIDFYTFDEADFQRQFRDMVDFQIDSGKEQILLLYKGNVVKGGIDISAYQDETIEDVFWDGSLLRYYAEQDDVFPLSFVTRVGLKLAGTEEIQYENLSRIICPVSIGEWGERSFTLGAPGVEMR